jgi:hypothetical protein
MNKKYYSRRWLNSKEGTAFIECSSSNDLSTYKDFSFKLSDCHKIVTIDFSFHNIKTKQERVKKINVMIDELNGLKAEIEKTEVRK